MSTGEPLSGDLSNREQEVAQAYAAGLSYKEIARELGVSPTTVRSHLRTIYGKLGVTSKIGLAQYLENKSAPESDRDSTAALADLALELDEAVRRERILAKVLRIISDQNGELDEVIDAVLDHSLEICEADFGVLFQYHGDLRYSEMRSRNISTAFAEWLSEQRIFEVDPRTALGLVTKAPKTVNITDVRNNDLYGSKVPLRVATADLAGARSFATIPMMSAGKLIGAFVVYRTRVHPFNDRSLELAQLFADQAVIAIENVRQFQALQARLERQAATRKILEVINNSRSNEAPVFDVIVENAQRLCDAPTAALVLGTKEDKHQVIVAHHGAVQNTVDLYHDGQFPMDPTVSFGARAILEKRSIHLHDMRDTDEYRSGIPAIRSLVDGQGIGTNLLVPLIADEKGIGCLVLFRHEVRPYADDQIALVETFAAQAVIAIENARQFRELQTRLERETVNRNILKFISESRDDEQPVFDAILENACRLCEAQMGAFVMGRDVGDKVVMVAHHGATEATQKLYRDGHYTIEPGGSFSADAILERKIIHVDDMANSKRYLSGDPRVRSLVEEQGIRTNLFVPLVSGGEGIGCLILFRRVVRPYTEDQIALVETFAEQAVIAIENVQQFRALEALNAELGERVEKQVGEIEKMSRLKRFLSPAVADALVSSGDEAKLSSHRSLIATLFCDIRGFTAFCETAEPEETIEVLQAYHEEMGKLISKHGGGVDKRMGDGIMVVFNDPLPCEDPAGDAVRLAIAMRNRMVKLCKRWKRLGHRLGFGVGISMGYATIGMVGSEGRYDYTASGTAVNLAARLCDRAADSEILLSPRAFTAIEGEFQAESSGELSLKGMREPVEVYRLIADKDSRS